MIDTIAKRLEFVTARLEAKNGAECSIGTGFFVGVESDEADKEWLYMVTNRHVLEGMDSVCFVMLGLDGNGRPDFKRQQKVEIKDLRNKLTLHPESSVDLCAFEIGEEINGLISSGFRPCYSRVSRDLIVAEDAEKKVDALSDILMIGYPSGLWDDANNLPIARKGILATPLYADYKGNPDFLMDIPVYPGSSGSPIFLFEENVYLKGNETFIRKDRVKLCGINKAVYERRIGAKDEQGHSVVASGLEVVTPIPINIGIAIKGRKLIEFIEFLRQMKATPAI